MKNLHKNSFKIASGIRYLKLISKFTLGTEPISETKSKKSLKSRFFSA